MESSTLIPQMQTGNLKKMTPTQTRHDFLRRKSIDLLHCLIPPQWVPSNDPCWNKEPFEVLVFCSNLLRVVGNKILSPRDFFWSSLAPHHPEVRKMFVESIVSTLLDLGVEPSLCNTSLPHSSVPEKGKCHQQIVHPILSIYLKQHVEGKPVQIGTLTKSETQ